MGGLGGADAPPVENMENYAFLLHQIRFAQDAENGHEQFGKTQHAVQRDIQKRGTQSHVPTVRPRVAIFERAHFAFSQQRQV